jgi:hypothetical protein
MDSERPGHVQEEWMILKICRAVQQCEALAEPAVLKLQREESKRQIEKRSKACDKIGSFRTQWVRRFGHSADARSRGVESSGPAHSRSALRRQRRSNRQVARRFRRADARRNGANEGSLQEIERKQKEVARANRGSALHDLQNQNHAIVFVRSAARKQVHFRQHRLHNFRRRQRPLLRHQFH